MSPRHLSACLALVLAAGVCPAAGPPAAGKVQALIEQMREVRQADYGYSPSVRGSIFLPLDREGELQVALLGQPAPARSQTMRELVRQGARAVPDLVAHLGDKRPTRLTIRHPLGDALWLPGQGLFALAGLMSPMGMGRPSSSYTLTVGDLSYVALGQIINRDHTVVSYIPSGNVMVTPVAASPDRIAELTKKWSRLTPAGHRASLLDDARRALDESRRVGACKRLAYYYPDTLEPLALQFLSMPTYDAEEVSTFFGNELSNAADAKERRRLLKAFVARHGKAGRDGVLRKLFADLLEEESEPAVLKENDEKEQRLRRLLAEMFGYPATVRAADRPAFLGGIERSEKLRLIQEALIHIPSKKIVRAVRDLLASIKDDDDLALACMKCLAGRGCDADIERYLRRRGEHFEEEDREALRAMLGWTPLHAAVARSRADLVPALLAAGAKPDARARNGDMPLHRAARAGDEEVLRLLLSPKADLDVKGRSGLTLAQEAARAEQGEAVLALVKRRCAIPDILVAAVAGRADLIGRFLRANPAALRETTYGGRTPLFLAVRHGHPAAVQLLLAGGADADAPLDGEGWGPLHEAAAAGHAAIARLLLAHKADVHARLEGSDRTPLHLAAGRGHAGVVRLLLEKGANIDFEDQTGRTALFHAVEAGHEAVARLLLGRRANPRTGPRQGVPPLHAAVSTGRSGLVLALLRAGVSPETRVRETGETALHRAAREGQVEAARLLIDRGARIDARDKEGNTPLHLAVHKGQGKIVRLLLERTADPEVANKADATPLHVAAWLGRSRPAGLLLRHGARVGRRAEGRLWGTTSLGVAASQGHADMVRLLLAHRADPYASGERFEKDDLVRTTALHAAASRGRVEVARVLLGKGVPVDVRDGSGRTPLHDAVLSTEHSEAMIRLLLAHKANVRAAAKDGWEPIHRAAQACNAAGVALLLDHKADVNAREKEEGRTPLHLAIEDGWLLDEPNEARSLPVVQLLLRRKADVTIKDKKGRSPLDLAAEMKYANIVRLLRKHGAAAR
jgi:ankyrin repeat protein